MNNINIQDQINKLQQLQEKENLIDEYNKKLNEYKSVNNKSYSTHVLTRSFCVSKRETGTRIELIRYFDLEFDELCTINTTEYNIKKCIDSIKMKSERILIYMNENSISNCGAYKFELSYGDTHLFSVYALKHEITNEQFNTVFNGIKNQIDLGRINFMELTEIPMVHQYRNGDVSRIKNIESKPHIYIDNDLLYLLSSNPYLQYNIFMVNDDSLSDLLNIMKSHPGLSSHFVINKYEFAINPTANSFDKKCAKLLVKLLRDVLNTLNKN